jgi:hypothetical protein
VPSEKIGCDKCGHLACVCVMQKRHKIACAFLISATCAIPIECRHGRDVCSICDPRTCGAGIEDVDFGPER